MVPSKRNKLKNLEKKIFFVGFGAGSRSASGSVSHKYGSEDPDLYQNVMDPEHWLPH
jgi:hypothetical protein